MRAAKFDGPGRPLSLERVDIPKPRPGHLLIRVEACGVCGSDLSISRGEFEVPVGTILGHEISGSAEDGKRYAIYYATGCGECQQCRKGWIVGCIRGSRRLGVNENGGFAEFVEVASNNLIPIPNKLSFEEAAVATDAVATCIHALLDNGRLRAGEVVAVIGIGGLGATAIGVAKAVGARVIAVTRSGHKRKLAFEMGADDVVLNEGDPSRLHGLNADVVVQLAPTASCDELAIVSCAQGGRVVLVAFSPHPFQASSLDLIAREVIVIGSRGMTKQNIRTALNWIAAGRIDTSPLLAAPRPLEAINQVLEQFGAGKILRSLIRT
jgi:D-arabinose 1-dehydrogenase-like Zn-dependent alcohol dehydrogenase